MSRIIYVNGEYVAEADARISVFDRGFLFADGVYEVTSVLNSRLVDNQAHLARLKRSLAELDMSAPVDDETLIQIQKNLVKKNKIKEGLVYLQITRGAAERDFIFPENIKPSLVMFTQEKKIIDNPQVTTGIAVNTMADIRWLRRDIKTVGLLAACMAKTKAVSKGVDDAWMIEDDFITEGSSNNAYIIQADGTLVTRQLGSEILAGITRNVILQLADKENLKIEERAFSLDEAINAREAFITSASIFVLPVVKINSHKIQDGKPGEITLQLRDLYIQAALRF